MALAELLLGQRALAEFEDQAGFSSGHFRFEAAFVEGSAEGVEPVGVSPSSECHESGATLERRVGLVI